MDMNWNDLRVVLAICREGTLSGAAKVLGTSHSTVFRQINAVEKKLATRFFNRLSHGYEMTEAGETVLNRAASIEGDILELERELKNKDQQLKGKICLTAPEGVTNYLLIPHLANFYREHPDIEIELIVSASDLQLSQHEADIAVRITKEPPPYCIGKKICEFSIGIYATESYLETVKDRDFPDYEYLELASVDWRLLPYWSPDSPPKIVFKSDSITSVTKAAYEDMGAVILPSLIGEKEPLLKAVTEPFKNGTELWILSHADLRQTARVKALMQHLHKSLYDERDLIEGNNH